MALAVEFVASFGLFPGLCDQEMSVGLLFKDVLLQIIQSIMSVLITLWA